jgi:hypothetical protein
VTDEDIVNAFTAKHGMTIMPGPFRGQHVDLVRMGREEERHQIVTWLRTRWGDGPGFLADLIETGEYKEIDCD